MNRDVEREKHIESYLATYYPELKYKLEEAEVLDVGCGPGKLAIPLSRYVKNIDGFDINSKSIDRANKKKEQLNISNVRFFLGRSEKLKKKYKEIHAL